MVELARLQMAGGRQAEALATLGHARERAPHSEDVLSAYAQVALAARAPVPAAEVLAPLARMCPTVAEYHYRLGVALMQAGDVTGAVESLQRAQSPRARSTDSLWWRSASRSSAQAARRGEAAARPQPRPRARRRRGARRPGRGGGRARRARRRRGPRGARARAPAGPGDREPRARHGAHEAGALRGRARRRWSVPRGRICRRRTTS